MNNNSNKKYLMALGMFLLMAGNAFAQEPVFDKAQTLTHTKPIDESKRKMLAQNPKVKFSNPQDVFCFDVGVFANMSGADIKTVFASWMGAKPFVRIKDKFTFGFSTNIIIHNYGLPSVKSVKADARDMYMSLKLKTGHGDYSIRAGKFSVLDYSWDFKNYMPISDFLMNEYFLDAGCYLQRAVIGEFSSGRTRAGIGYAEDTAGFKFTGHGWAVLVAEENFQNVFKIGGMIKTKNHQSLGNVHLIVKPTHRDEIFLEFLNMGGRFAFYGSYVHKFQDDKSAISVNGYVQSGDGISGGNIGFYHDWCYVVVGAIRCNPLRGSENDSKFYPVLEIGVRKMLYPSKPR